MSIVVEMHQTSLEQIVDIVDWAKKHCSSYIKITTCIYVSPTETKPIYNFYFGNEKDASWFRLRWE